MISLLTSDYQVAFANRSYREHFGALGGKRCYEHRFGFIKQCEFCESYKVFETVKPHHWELSGLDGIAIILMIFRSPTLMVRLGFSRWISTLQSKKSRRSSKVIQYLQS